jgi:tetratricopeptide (TPR) repeat protein
MLVTIREYAIERLAESGEHDDIQERHARRYLALAEGVGQHLQGKDRQRWLDLLERDHDNLRAALEWSIAGRRTEEACRLAFALWRFWQVRAHLVEAAQWCDRIVALPTDGVPPLVLLRGLEAAGGIAYWRGDVRSATAAYAKAVALANAHGDDAAQANAEYNLSFAYGVTGSDPPRALALVKSAHEKWLRAGDPIGAARALWGVATFLQFGQRGSIPRATLEEALAAVREALAVHRAGTNRFDLAWSLHLTGMVEMKLDHVPETDAALREATTLFNEDSDLTGLAIIASDYAELAAIQGQPERQATLVGAAEMLAQRAGTGLLTDIARQDGRALPSDIAPEFRSALERGLAMEPKAAVAYALGDA